MNQQENFEQHALNLGKLIGNLQMIEMYARMVLVERETYSQMNTQLPQLCEGEYVEWNAFTDNKSLRPTLEEYNKHASENLKVDVENIVKLRDALAHGRIFGFGPLSHRSLRLLKFNPDNNQKAQNKVEVTMALDMTEEWFIENISFLFDESKKIAELRKSKMIDMRSIECGVSTTQ